MIGKYTIDQLSEDQAKRMLKAIAAWNSDAIPHMEFNKNYLKYMDTIEVEVLEDAEAFRLTYKGVKTVE